MSKVYLVGITTPVLLGPVETAEELIAYTARVSNPSNQMNKDTAPKLLKYLVKNHHWSPFEMVHMVMGIETTRDIAHQIVRHRSFSFQEFSQRYADANELGFETREARLQDSKNRQNSLPTDNDQLKSDWHTRQQAVLDIAEKTYNWALFNGLAKEQARAVLPEGLTRSVLYMSGTLRSWIHYCELRTDPGTQKEHREVAQACKNIILDRFPSLEEVLSVKE